MESGYEPFKLVEEDGRTILRLHGKREQRVGIEADKVHIIMDAIAEGLDVDVEYADIEGNLDIKTIAEKLERTEDGKLVIEGSIRMAGCNIGGNAYFGDAQFTGNANFWSAQFSGDAYFANVFMAKSANFANVTFRENHVVKGLWNATLGRIKCLHWQATDFSGFNTERFMDGASNPWLKRYIDDELWIRSWRKRSWWRKRLFTIWELTSHCGRSIGLWAFWSALIAAVFAFVYRAFGPESITFNVARLDSFQPDIWDYLYYSVVTFTTLGFGDIVPLTKPARLAVGAEVVLGYVMLGGLISIFANKLARRS